jgi:hypothetical protein
MTFHILRRRSTGLQFGSRMTMKGQFRLIVRTAEGNVRRDTGWFDNLILDSGLNKMGTATPISGAAIGTDATAPNVADTGLIAQAKWTTTLVGSVTKSNAGSSPYAASAVWTYRFAIGDLNGNYAEVGVGWATGSNMFSRALILDGGGSPTTITVGATEQLDVMYTLKFYPPLVDTSQSIVIDGNTTTVTGRASYVTSTSYWSPNCTYPPQASSSGGGVSCAVTDGVLGAITATITGTNSYCDGASTAAYSNGSYTRTCTYTFSLTAGNVTGGIDACYMHWAALGSGPAMGSFQYGFSVPIAKDNTKTLALSFSIAWARH